MKKFVVYIILLCAGTLVSSSLSAQERLKLKIGYNTAFPVGEFSNLMGKNSYRGFHGEFLYPVTPKIDIGFGVANQDFYEKHPRRLYNTKDGVISAVLTNSIQVTPIMVKGNYNFRSTGVITPYAGLGAGFNFIRYGQYLGEFGESVSAFKPAVTANAGLNFFFNPELRSSGINLGANFNYMPYNRDGISTMNNWGIHAGVFFPLR